jgi:D-methionine transport system permease protein
VFDEQMIEMLWEGVIDTLYMTIASTALSYVFGMIMGVLLVICRKDGIAPRPMLYACLDVVVNLTRSFPFLILMIAVIPVTRFIVGTTIGNNATVVPLVIAAAPFVARLIEASLLEVDGGVVEAAQSMGASTWQIITKVLLPEALPSLLNGSAVAAITILGYSAMSGAVGGGGNGLHVIGSQGNGQLTAVGGAVVVDSVLLTCGVGLQQGLQRDRARGGVQIQRTVLKGRVSTVVKARDRGEDSLVGRVGVGLGDGSLPAGELVGVEHVRSLNGSPAGVDGQIAVGRLTDHGLVADDPVDGEGSGHVGSANRKIRGGHNAVLGQALIAHPVIDVALQGRRSDRALLQQGIDIDHVSGMQGDLDTDTAFLAYVIAGGDPDIEGVQLTLVSQNADRHEAGHEKNGYHQHSHSQKRMLAELVPKHIHGNLLV